ncbi:MAG: ABC transporter ATP-binding protein [Deltaproteobacteria bacterium]|nr:ABC transporter ATP-binding protein [Deltaproteobacteria bacterium]
MSKPSVKGFSQSQPLRLGVIGPNGRGKTTLFSVIMGLERPLVGTIGYNGEEVQTKEGWARLRKNVGLVFQNSDDQLFMPTVLEDVAFDPLNLGLSPVQARQRALDTLRKLGLEGFEGRVTHKLFGGEKRLVALATVLAMQLRIILLDEPTNDLDQDTRQKLIDILVGLPQAQILVTHDWDFLDHVANSLAVLQDGRLVAQEKDILHTHTHAHPGGQSRHGHGEV